MKRPCKYRAQLYTETVPLRSVRLEYRHES